MKGLASRAWTSTSKTSGTENTLIPGFSRHRFIRRFRGEMPALQSKSRGRTPRWAEAGSVEDTDRRVEGGEGVAGCSALTAQVR